MLAKLRAWKTSTQDVKEHRDTPKGTNFHEEYNIALRTKSYVNFFNKVQLLANHNKFSETLLEPCQETIIASIVDSATLSKTPELKNLMLSYFDISAEASHICTHLLKSINQVHSNYQFKDGEYSLETFELIIFELNSFTYSNNLKSHDFNLINDKHSSVLHHLKSMRKKVGRKIKPMKYLKKTSKVCVRATHTLTAFIMGPAILISFPFKHIKRKLRAYKFSGDESLSKLKLLKSYLRSIDLAAKGTYILNKDFDTMSRLVARLHDEIEHSRAMVQFCLERKENNKLSLQVVKELKRSDVGFRKQVEELEEHVCLCLVTINQARALVVKEMKRSRLCHIVM